MNSHTRQLSKRDFNLRFNLYRHQPWLCDCKDSLDLLINLCPDKETVSLVTLLLQRFHMFSPDEFQNAIKEMITQLVDTVQITPQNSIIVASCIDDNPDGSQDLLQQLRVFFAKRGLRNFKFINKYGSGLAKLKANMWFIVVDDFTGSGKTVLARKKMFDEHCRTTRIAAHFYACSVAAMSSAVELLNVSGIQFWTPRKHEKGIPQVYQASDQAVAYDRMLRLEALVNDNSSPKVYPFGYGRAEAIVALGKDRNTPNSVYPVFWTPTHADGSVRKTILCRG